MRRPLTGIAIACAALLLLSACQEDGPLGSATETDAAPDLLADQRLSCERDGGRWGLRAGESLFVCFRNTRDANRSCGKDSDCEGFCLARSRTCAPVTPFLGCHEILTEGGQRATQCTN